MKITYLRFFVFALFSLVSSGVYAENIKPSLNTIQLYNWWDYIAPGVIQRLANSGYQTEIMVYKSNEVALSRLSAGQHNFDVAIVSNFALPYLMSQGLIETNQFQQVTEERHYLPLFHGTAPHCLPYLWSTTVFAAKKNELSILPGSLSELIALKSRGYKIGIIDDLYETVARLIGDSKTICGQSSKNYFKKNVFDVLSACSTEQFLPQQGLDARDFDTFIADLLAQPKIAVYGWHGEVLSQIWKYPSLKVALPKTHPVIGYDAVCIMKRHDRRTPVGSLVRYVELLTDMKSTELNISTNQYFSPYSNHTAGLMPQTRELYFTVTERLKHTHPIIIKPPTFPVHMRLNAWWKSVRYAQ